VNGRERIGRVMGGRIPDRVPVFCQLSLGHYMLQTEHEPYRIWHSSDVFAQALLELADRYGFDGILVNLPGRPPDWESHLAGFRRSGGETRLDWDNGGHTRCPDDDNASYHSGRPRPTLDQIQPEILFYIDPHDITGAQYPYTFGFETGVARNFPDYQLDPLHRVRELARDRLHMSSEVFSPFTQLMDLLGYTEALSGLVDDPQKCERILDALAEGAAELALMQARAGADAVLVSSAFAGGGFISREHYRRFVLPFERRIVQRIHGASEVPVYVHTCGAIADRIGLMVKAGYDGVDTMDPPPLGDTSIEEVKQRFGRHIFLKGNLDPVNLLLRGTKAEVHRGAEELVRRIGPGGGYILSSACSVAPATPPQNLLELRSAAAAHPY